MKKQITLLLIFAALMILSAACSPVYLNGRTIRGNGNVVEETRQVGSFNEIELEGIGDVYVEFGDETALVIEADENLLEYIETDTSGQKLVIGLREHYNFDPSDAINFYVTVTELEGVQISGMGSMFLPEIETNRFDIQISGAGNVSIDALYADRLFTHMSGLGDVDIDGGEVAVQEVSISGSGSYSAREMSSGDAEVSVSGLGSATVSVSDYLQASISGAGDINYYGSPEVDVDISGLGSLHALDD